MKKRLFHPYMRPLVKGYENKKFLSQSKILLGFIKNSRLKNVFCLQDKEWIFVGNQRALKANSWTPKIYVCVSPRDYWEVIFDLISLTQRADLQWKFCQNFKHFVRPDKIVIYLKNVSEVKKVIGLIRPLLKGKKFHELRFAEKRERGIYIGADPNFLGTSWRFYRWAIDEVVIKTNLKKGRLSNDVKESLKNLNISLKHEGPLKLKPKTKNNRFIKKIWKEANS